MTVIDSRLVNRGHLRIHTKGVSVGLAHDIALYGPMVISVQVLCLRCLKSQRFIKHRPPVPPQFVPNSKECHQCERDLIGQRHRVRYCK